MKSIIAGLITLIAMPLLADDKCDEQVRKAAVNIEALSQSAPTNKITSTAKLLKQVRTGGEFLNTYSVDTQDTRNDGYSLYKVSIYSGACEIIKKVEMITQD